MASIKGVNRSASVALAPDGGYMAAGTMAGAVDLSFSSSASLEIFELDFKSDDKDLKLVAESPSSERFNRLTWGKNGSGSDEFSLGLIAGGFVDGNIDVWNPRSLIRSEPGDKSPIVHLSRHKGPVRGLEFNMHAPNLLASGADDGEICIWDLAKPTQPIHFPPLRGSGAAGQGEISFLSWNSKVHHILASTSYDGTTFVWDLKKQKPVISFSDSVRRRCSVLQWNPDLATQLVVASDEDGSPSLRLWDMRNVMSPVKEFVGHTRGVIAMAWCSTDSSYLVTCAKDNRTICWDTVSAEIVSELPAGSNWNFDVHWYPKIPGIISASSFDGKIGIYNVEGSRQHSVEESDFRTEAPLRAPRWLKRPVGASFGFGGKLISFHPRASSRGGPGSSEVFVRSVVTEQTLINRSTEFEAAIQNGEKASLRALCDKKFQECESVDDRETWGFLKVLLEDDGTARSKLLTHLGFSLPEETKDDLQEQQLPQQVDALGLEDSTVEKAVYENNNSATFPIDNGEDFFNNLPSPKADTLVANTGEKFGTGDVVEPPSDDQTDVLEESSDPSFDDAVQRALVVGDYNAAVSLCISANKIADALVIANVGGELLWKSTRDKFLKISQSPYLKVVSAMVNNDLESIVKTRPLKSWKETLALLCSFASEGEWITLCNLLASKLLSSGNTSPATLCFICAGNIDKTVEIWSRNLAVEHGQSSVDLLQDLMEKTIVLALASGERRFSASLCKLVERYAEILTSQGLLREAMEYLKLLGSEELSPELVILKDRIAYSTEAEKESPNSSASVSWQPQMRVDTFQQSYTPQYTAHADKFQQSYTPQYMTTDPISDQYQPPAQYQLAASQSQIYQSPVPQSQIYYPPAPQQPQIYQPTVPQPNMFVPSQPAQVLQPNLSERSVPPHSTVRPFVPVAGVALRNAEQYQQATVPKQTLSSQLYPGSNPSFQPMVPPPVGPVGPSPIPALANNSMPATPDPSPMGFTPANLSGATTQISNAPPAAVAAPPPTVQTVDTKNVPDHQKPVIATLSRLFYETSEAFGGARANPAKKREIEDNSKKIGALFAKLNSGDISKNAADKLVSLCQALDKGDYASALQIQVMLTTSDWDECNFWLATLKRMIKTRQNVRL